MSPPPTQMTSASCVISGIPHGEPAVPSPAGEARTDLTPRVPGCISGQVFLKKRNPPQQLILSAPPTSPEAIGGGSLGGGRGSSSVRKRHCIMLHCTAHPPSHPLMLPAGFLSSSLSPPPLPPCIPPSCIPPSCNLSSCIPPSCIPPSCLPPSCIPPPSLPLPAQSRGHGAQQFPLRSVHLLLPGLPLQLHRGGAAFREWQRLPRPVPALHRGHVAERQPDGGEAALHRAGVGARGRLPLQHLHRAPLPAAGHSAGLEDPLLPLQRARGVSTPGEGRGSPSFLRGKREQPGVEALGFAPSTPSCSLEKFGVRGCIAASVCTHTTCTPTCVQGPLWRMLPCRNLGWGGAQLHCYAPAAL